MAGGAAAKAAEARKHVDYDADFVMTAPNSSCKLVPFGLDTFGAWGPSATSFLRTLALGLHGTDVGAIAKFERECSVRVSVALQRAVARQVLTFAAAVGKMSQAAAGATAAGAGSQA